MGKAKEGKKRIPVRCGGAREWNARGGKGKKERGEKGGGKEEGAGARKGCANRGRSRNRGF